MIKQFFISLLLLFSITSYSATYYVATNGNDNNAGTIQLPWATVQFAVNQAVTGDTVYFRGGDYLIPHTAENNIIVFPNSGTSTDPICFFNYPGEYPVFDFRLMIPTGVWPELYNTGFYIYYENYISFRGLELKNIYQSNIDVGVNGILCYGATNIRFENMSIHNVGGVGIGYFSGGGIDSTYFINVDVYQCADSLNSVSPGGHADGYFIQLIDEGYALIEGCRAWECSDDGFNLDGGGIMEVKNCWSFSNGDPLWEMGDGNGFKLGPTGGGDGTSIYRVLTNCIAANNHAGGPGLAAGYNHNNGQDGGAWPRSRIYNSVSYDNDLGYWIQTGSTYGDFDDIYRNCISYLDDKYFASWPVEPTAYDHNTFTWVSIVWPYTEGLISMSAADFLSLDVSELDNARQSDWSLPEINFMKLAAGSQLIDAGIDVGLPYNGSAPDIGWNEYGIYTPPTTTKYIYRNDKVIFHNGKVVVINN